MGANEVILRSRSRIPRFDGEAQRTVDDLVDLFRGKIEDPREFFERVMSCKSKLNGRYEDRTDVVIPYRSVIEFYQGELGYQKASEAEEAALAEKRKRRPVSEDDAKH
jgi:hypothetical protein